MKKVKHILCLAFVFVATCVLGQSDTARDVGDAGADAVTSIFEVLSHFNVRLEMWESILVVLVPILLRFLGKRKINQSHARDIRKILNDSPTMRSEHRDQFEKLAARLEGAGNKKKPKRD